MRTFTSDEAIKKLLIPKKTEQNCYDAGYDCGMNGVSATNCCFSFFSSKEKTAEWERGKKQAEIDKVNQKQ